MDDGQQVDRPDVVSRRFAWLAGCVFYQAAWERLVFFKAALQEAQLEYVQLPPLQRASSQMERDWGFGPLATVAELEAFTNAVSAACSGQG